MTEAFITYSPLRSQFLAQPAAARIHWLLLPMCFSLVVPVFDVPFFGLSFSAPLFCVVALDCLLRPIDWRPYQRWILLAVGLVAGVWCSVAGNVLLGKLTAVDLGQALMLVRFGYWMLVFVVAAVLAGRYEAGRRIAVVFGVGAMVLGALRLAEAVVFGHWGSGDARFLSQNDYGWGFSAFTPFATWVLAQASGWRKAMAGCGWLLLMLAVIGNGSRSSWVAVAAGLALLVWCQLCSRSGGKRQAGVILVGAGLLAATIALAPAALRDPVADRAATFVSLDRDKPFLARQLLVRKGLRLFLENPVFGVGLSRFTEADAAVTPLPAYRPRSRFWRKTSHNAYVQTLAETGLAGALPLLVLLLSLAWQGPKAALSAARAGETWGLPLLAGCFGMSLHLWTLSGLTSTSAWFLFGLLAGVVVRSGKSRWRASLPSLPSARLSPALQRSSRFR